jgi:hypothetical protein
MTGKVVKEEMRAIYLVKDRGLLFLLFLINLYKVLRALIWMSER